MQTSQKRQNQVFLSAPTSAPAPALALAASPRYLKRFMRQHRLRRKKTDNNNLKHNQETCLIEMHPLSWK